MNTQSPGHADHGSIDFRRYLEVGRRRLAWIILPALGIFFCTVVVARRLPDVFRSETVILVDAQQVPAAYVASTVSSTIQDRLTTIQQQVMSPTRLEKMIEKLNLYPNLRGHVSDETLVKKIQKATLIDVVNPGGGRLSSFKLGFESESPAEASKVANELALTFIDENNKARQAQFRGTAEFLDKELQDAKKDLDAKDHQIEVITSSSVLDLPESKQFHIEALNNLKMQLTASQDRVNRAQQNKVMLESMMNTNAPTVDLDAGGGGANVSPLQAQIQKAEAHLSELQARYGPSFPDVQKAQAELERLKKKGADEEAHSEAPQQAEVPVKGRKNPVVEGQLQKLNQEIEEQTKLQADLQKQVDFHVSKLEREPVFEQQIAGLTRDRDSLRAHYQNLLDKKLAAQMASELEDTQKGERFVVLDAAPVPQHPYGPNRILISVAGLFGGLLGGIGLAIFAEMNDASVRSESEVTQLLGMRVLTGMPLIRTAAQVRSQIMLLAGASILTVAGSAGLGLVISKLAGRIGLL
jgi:succinoglycan biosynthesis transport protein ExoP